MLMKQLYLACKPAFLQKLMSVAFWIQYFLPRDTSPEMATPPPAPADAISECMLWERTLVQYSQP